MTAGEPRASLERDPRASQNADRAFSTLMRILEGIYQIGVDGHGLWIALRRDGQTALIADGPDSLAALIREDCAPPPESTQ